MNTLHRVAGVILASLLLASTGVPAFASPPAGRPTEETYRQGAGPDSPPHRETPTETSAPDALAPAWLSPTPGSLGQTKWEGAPLEPELLHALADAKPDEHVRVIVYLHEQVDLKVAASGAREDVPAKSTDEVRFRIVTALQTEAARSQAPLRAYLAGARAAGSVRSYTPFWIFNGIAVQAHPSLVYALAAHPTVAIVRLDHYRKWVDTATPGTEFSAHLDRRLVDGGHPDRIHSRARSEAVEWNVAHIRADQVWASLQVSGTGAVVAGMDTGVDWIHPALQANYRGYNPPGPSNHTYSWHDATGDGALYPVDGHGHGTHTLGTAVGQGGIGVAPGARWIGVRALDAQGHGYDSWIHDGFQWLLAPGGESSKAPDVVNCSWGNTAASMTTFRPDLQALRAAGIMPVFANGNDGPAAGTVHSPASLSEAFAVGATDSNDMVAAFSSRGPSPWGEVRPHVAAPGALVRSSLPGGAYGQANGTSMATPHVAGIAALLRSVSPTLSITRAALIITSTAVPLSTTLPNNDSGWGRVDAHAAVAALAQPGFIAGTLSRSGGGDPIAGATITAAPREGGGGMATSDSEGNYLLTLAPATYDLTASAFGYESSTAWGIVVAAGATHVQDFVLNPLPTGTLRGQITDAATGAPLVATVLVSGTPLEVTANSFEFSLPAGTYTVRAYRSEYRVVTTTVDITVGEVTSADLALTPGPSILLIDSGPWHYHSQIAYFRQALDDLAYTYDEWSINSLPNGVPTADDLSPYEVVVWSAPKDAPGYIGAGGTITGYLSTGGRLLLSGQEVGFLDGGGLAFEPYYRDYLKAQWVRDSAQVWTLQGTPGDLYAGLTITISGSGGADNQESPDEIAVLGPDTTVPVIAYRGNGCGGVRAGTCVDYRAVYLSFGFEAINDRTSRQAIMGRALDWLTAPPPNAGLELRPSVETGIGTPGSVITYPLRVRHTGQAGGTDAVSLSLDGASWPVRLSAPALSLAPCTSATVVLSVTVPPTAGWNVHDIVTLTARSSLSPTLAPTVVITSKTAAPVLLVDDDRWYDQEDKYKAALTDAGFSYDLWDTGGPTTGAPGGSPPVHVLQRYPIVVWFTGYDWHEPVTAEEETALAAYLDGGGRLFLSSQDFLYYHLDTAFSQEHLGVMGYTEYVTPTLASGVPEDPIGGPLGTYALDFPFQNWSDALLPTPGTAVPFRDQERRAIAVAQHGEDFKSVFFSFPFEALEATGRGEVMKQILGWLSWLGDSSLASDRAAVSGGDVLTYSIALHNDSSTTASTTLSNTVPADLALVAGSLTGPAVYHSATRRFSWAGPLEPGETLTFTYQTTLTQGLPAGTPITNTVRVGSEDQEFHFFRTALVRVDAPDLSPSTLQCDPSSARPGTLVTCTLALANAGTGDAPQASAIHAAPADAWLVPSSLSQIGGGATEISTGTVQWAGVLSAGAQVTLTYALTLPTNPVSPPLYSVAFVEDGTGQAWERAAWLFPEPCRLYMPTTSSVKRQTSGEGIGVGDIRP